MSKYYIYNLSLGMIFLLSVFILSCDDTITENDIDKVIIPNENVSYAKYIQPLFFEKCGFSDCHIGSSAGGYNLETWSNATVPGIVDPYSVETSRLVWRIDGLGVPIMPPTDKAWLTSNQREGIKTWIKEGARNN
ncbi:MAG: hypothetical protein ABFS12_07700 [Bacteroidota bacterium]